MPEKDQAANLRSEGILSDEMARKLAEKGHKLYFDPVQMGWIASPVIDDLAELSLMRPRRDTGHKINFDRAIAWQSIVERLRRRLPSTRGGNSSSLETRLATALECVDYTLREWSGKMNPAVLDRHRTFLQSQALGFSLPDDGRPAQLHPETMSDSPEFRPWQPGDVETYSLLLGEPDMWRWIPDAMPAPMDPETARQLIEVASSSPRHEVLACQVDGNLCGQVRVLFDRDVSGIRSGELSFWVGKDFWGRGYMKRILAAYLPIAMARHKLDCLYAWIHPENVASAKAVLATGFFRDSWDLEDEIASASNLTGYQRYKFFNA